jgi:hypothetical protein
LGGIDGMMSASLPGSKTSQAKAPNPKGSVSLEIRQFLSEMSENLLGQVRAMVSEVKELVSKVEDRVEGVEGAVKTIQVSIEELKNKNGNGLEIGQEDEEGEGVTLMSLGKRKRTAVSKDGLIVMNAIQNRDNNLKARLRECLRKFCLSPAGNLYFQGFKANFIGQILFLNFKNDSIFDCRGDKTTGT